MWGTGSRNRRYTAVVSGTLALVLALGLAVISPGPRDEAAAQTEHGTLRPVTLDGLGNPNNYGFHRLYQFQGYLWALAGNRIQGAIIYRSRDGENWEAVSPPGFGDRANDSIVTLAWFRGANDPPNSTGKLYAATFCFRCQGGQTAQGGGDIWRGNADAKNPEDIVWENITKDAFGDARRRAFVGFVVFKGHLYTGTFQENIPNESGSEIFRTDTGDPDDWHLVAPKGMGNPRCNTDFHLNIVYGDHVYFGSEEAGCLGVRGGDIWRTDGNLTDGQNTLDGWEKANLLPGGGKNYNNNIYGMDVFQGHFYFGTWTWAPPGVEVFRAPLVPAHEGQTPVPFLFQQVNASGFGNPRNTANLGMVHLGDTLYVAGADVATRGQGYFYRTGGGANAAEHILNWHEITAEGFPPTTGSGLLPLDGPFHLEVFRNKIYVAVEQGGKGTNGRGQLWAYEPANVPVLSVTDATRCLPPDGQVTISGTGFDDYQGWKNYPVLDGRPLEVLKWTDTEIVAQVPDRPGSGIVGVYKEGDTANGPRIIIAPVCPDKP